MKSLVKTICAVGLMIWTTACEDFLTEDPKGRLSSVYFFAGPADLDFALNQLYYQVQINMNSNARVGTNFTIGDDLSTHPGASKDAMRDYDQFDAKDNNPWMAGLWNAKWALVKNANFIINGARNTPDASEEEINNTIGQAHYWRAWTYFYIVRTWGPVPIMLEEEITYDAPLNSIEEIYDLIVSDLKTAENLLPINYTRAPYSVNGRNRAAAQAAAKATLAYVYMSMAGWPLNKGTEYYQLAAAKALEVITAVENGTYNYALLEEFAKINSWEYNDNHPEALLSLFYNRDTQGQTWPCVAFLLDQAQGGWGDMQGEIKFWKDFPEGPRKEGTYFPKIILTGETVLRDWWYDTDPPSRPVVAPPLIKNVEGAVRGAEFDYTDPTPIASAGEKFHKLILLSEVYCWYAEAVGRSGQTNAKAIELLNKVRNRADGAETNLYPASMTASELAEAAYNEHGWEITGSIKGIIAPRCWDQLRMNRLKDHFEFRKQNPLIEVAPGVFLKEGVDVAGEWKDWRNYAAYPSSDAVSTMNIHMVEENAKRQ